MFEDNAVQLALFTTGGAGALDVDDTTWCPLDGCCEACGGADPDLRVCTASVPLGVVCVTLCGKCAEAARVPAPSAWSRAARRVVRHCDHLGIRLDQMADALGADRRGRGDR